MKNAILISCFLLLALLSISSFSASKSDGTLLPEQAAYDVTFYDLKLNIYPEIKEISGSLLCKALVINSIDTLVLDLSTRLTVDSILIKQNNADFVQTNFNHSGGYLNIATSETIDSGNYVSAHIFYHGKPKQSQSPPWDDGLVWRKTSTNQHWLGVACETSGADVWWPCKDHPSDEPDSMAISFTVPNPLTCVSNGKFLGSEANTDSTTTFNWFVSTPINNYNVTFYAAEYDLIEDQYFSTSGDSIPFYFWVLPEEYETALGHMEVFKQEFDFLESIGGPFPFGTDKHGWAHSPYWGMEHQSIIAYGHDFTVNDWGYDYIHFHELAHEWWGNHITAQNWADVWIHEGIATYTEALYVEHLQGFDKYLNFMRQTKPSNGHNYPLVPYVDYTAAQAFDNLNPYNRGAAVMHTFRYHLGDSLFFKVLKQWAYPDTSDYDNTKGRQCRIVGTDDLKEQAESISNKDLTPFFDVFFREIKYPQIKIHKALDSTTFEWATENEVALDVNIPVMLNGAMLDVEMSQGKGVLNMHMEDTLEIDPESWLLKGQVWITEDTIPDTIPTNVNLNLVDAYYLGQNYPNPFTTSSTITFNTENQGYVRFQVFNTSGKLMETLLAKDMRKGEHKVHIDGSKYESGIYFYNIQAGSFIETKAFIVE